MTNKGFIAAVLVSALAVSGSAALAFGPGRHGGDDARMNFDALDADQSGEVTREEMQAHMTSRFTETDLDGDGMLSAEEMAAEASKRIEDRVARMIEQFDKNGDGALSMDEMPRPDEKRAARMFDMIDSDDSGGISREEFDEARAHMGKRRSHWGGHRHQGDDD